METSQSSLGHKAQEDGFLILSDEEIEQIMVVCKPLPQDLFIQIDPDTFCGTSESKNEETTKFDDHFVCRICQNVVIDAEECSKCQNCFCRKCMNQWKENCLE